MLHLAVPGQKGDLAGAPRGCAAALERRVERRCSRAGQVPDAQLAVGCARRKKRRAERVELQALDLRRRKQGERSTAR